MRSNKTVGAVAIKFLVNQTSAFRFTRGTEQANNRLTEISRVTFQK